MITKQNLFNENEKLKRTLFIWENIGIGINSSVKEKEIAAKKFLEENNTYNSYEVCNTIKLNRGTFYNYINYGVEKPWYEINEEKLLVEIKDILEKSYFTYGAGRIHTILKKKGIAASTDKIAQIMRKYKLKSNYIIKRPNRRTKTENSNSKYYKNHLKRRFNQDAPNKVWVSDFLEINVNGVKFYLCVILDLYARMVIAWRLSHNKNANLIVNTFKDAYENRGEPKGLMFHSDRGIEFVSDKFMNLLKMLNVKQSFSRAGNPNDNAAMESFFSTLRRDHINSHIHLYENSMVIKSFLNEYFNFYNNERLHTTLGQGPKEYEENWYKNHK